MSKILSTRTERVLSRNLKSVVLATFVLATVSSADAQQAKKVPRIGFLTLNSAAAVATRIAGFHRGLRDLGYVEGENIAIDYRYADGKLDQRAQLLAELIRLNVDIIVTHSTDTVLAVKKANQTIPIV